MVNVQKGNVFLNISNEEVDKYMAKGFSIVDEFGRVIKQSIPTELGELQKAYSDHEEIIKKKDAEIAELKAEIQRLTAGADKTPAKEPESPAVEEEETPAEDNGWDEWNEAEEIEEKPKKSKKSK